MHPLFLTKKINFDCSFFQILHFQTLLPKMVKKSCHKQNYLKKSYLKQILLRAVVAKNRAGQKMTFTNYQVSQQF